MKKRLLSALLAVCMAASLLVLPAGAAAADTVRFADIRDTETAVAVESLRLMGVLDGYQDGNFRPDAVLTRAQFCKMAVYAMNGESELGLYRTVTVFPDVKPFHWASSYINMAAKGKNVIAGYPDGKFHPERTVTLGQAVTILLRLLDYKDENVGGVWPDSYMAVGATIGLTDGVGADGNAPLTRGQAARLFLNLLRADKREGGTYLSTIGTEIADVVLVTSAATAADGRDNGLQLDTSDQVYQLASGKTSNGALNGCKGTLVLNKQGKVLTFVPDLMGTSKVVTISTATATQITDITGTKYTVASGANAYYNGKQQAWSELYSWLNAGASATLYLNASGSVEYVFVGGGTSSNEAVIVYDNESTAGFDSLAGGSGFQIYKNGLEATAKDMRKYDVATYSAATNSIRVCDNKITGFYETCKPNPQEPTEITVLGHAFKVLPTAVETLSQFKPGDQITLLLTEDNQVAGAVEAKGNVATANIVGIARKVTSGSATVDLLCGISISGSTTLSDGAAEQLSGQLVRVSSNKKGYISLSRLTGGVSGSLDVAARTLGSKKLADNVMVFENTSDGVQSISLSQLTSATIPSNQITYAATDWTGREKEILIGYAVGSTILYGRTIFEDGDTTWTDPETGEETTSHGNNKITLDAGSKTYGPYETGYRSYTGECIGISLTGTGSNKHIAALVRLTALKNVSNSAWSGQGAVTVGGRTYTVPSDVLCYNRQTKDWVSLSAAHAYASESTLYIHNGVVRIIEVG